MILGLEHPLKSPANDSRDSKKEEKKKGLTITANPLIPFW